MFIIGSFRLSYWWLVIRYPVIPVVFPVALVAENVSDVFSGGWLIYIVADQAISYFTILNFLLVDFNHPFMVHFRSLGMTFGTELLGPGEINGFITGGRSNI